LLVKEKELKELPLASYKQLYKKLIQIEKAAAIWLILAFVYYIFSPPNARFTRRERSERSVCNRLLGRAQRGLIGHR
jgi:hypothetical protein